MTATTTTAADRVINSQRHELMELGSVEGEEWSGV